MKGFLAQDGEAPAYVKLGGRYALQGTRSLWSLGLG